MGYLGEGSLCGPSGLPYLEAILEGSKIPFEVWTDHKNLEALKAP